MTPSNMLTFTIVVKDLAALTVSGLAEVKMGTLSTTSLALTMTGAGSITLDQLTADSLNINVSGLGNVALAGQVTDATVNIPGAGNVSAPDLKIKTAEDHRIGVGQRRRVGDRPVEWDHQRGGFRFVLRQSQYQHIFHRVGELQIPGKQMTPV